MQEKTVKEGKGGAIKVLTYVFAAVGIAALLPVVLILLVIGLALGISAIDDFKEWVKGKLAKDDSVEDKS